MSDDIETLDGLVEVPIPKRPRRAVKIKWSVIGNDFIASQNGEFWRFGSTTSKFDARGNQWIKYHAEPFR